MPRPNVPDTSVFIRVIRDPHRWDGFQQDLASGRLWLSSVVLAELYAGTRSREEALLLDRLVAAMDRAARLLTPTMADWARAGRLIARRIRRDGALRPRDHLADVLIVVTTARLGGTVVTANVRHFGAWASLATAAGLEVAIVPDRQ